MRDPKRIHEVLMCLEELWNRYPDWRLMQLICNMQSISKWDMFYVEDDVLVEVFKDLIENGF